MKCCFQTTQHQDVHFLIRTLQERMKTNARRLRQEVTKYNVREKYREAKMFLQRLKHLAKEVCIACSAQQNVLFRFVCMQKVFSNLFGAIFLFSRSTRCRTCSCGWCRTRSASRTSASPPSSSCTPHSPTSSANSAARSRRCFSRCTFVYYLDVIQEGVKHA